MKNISTKARVLIYAAVFVVAAVITFCVKIGIHRPDQSDSSTMGSATLPIVYMQTESGTKYNYLHGYTGKVDQSLIHDAITPITSDRKMDIYIRQYGNVISGISYELRSLDGTGLVERSDVSDYDSDGGIIHASMGFRNLMDSGREYMLKINIGTEQGENAAFYTRVIIMDDAYTDRKLDYINFFSGCTMDADSLDQITAKLETDSTGDNTNLGRVNIHSRLSQIGFASLKPVLEGERYITINEIDKATASISVRYTASTDDERGNFRYNVKEFYRINQPDDTVTYVYSYDRWMNQVFDPGYAVSSTGELYLGISSDDVIEMKSDSSGKITCFVRENSLWRYNSVRNDFVKIFDFSQSDNGDLREDYEEHAVRILDIDSDGDVRFIVYGYMNRGIHEGRTGISVFNYDASENMTDEIIFIPKEEPYKSIAQDISILAYVNENGILYLYNSNTIYSVDCNTKECMVVADRVITDSCAMSEAGGMLMYQTGDKSYDCSEMYIMLLENGEKYRLEADEGRRIKALGFIDGNVVYGQARADMIYVDNDGNVTFPMEAISLMNNQYEVVREYAVSNTYIMAVSVNEDRITMQRATLDANNNLVRISDDRLLSSANESKTSLMLTERTTESRQREKYISLRIKASGTKASYKSASYKFSANATINMAADGNISDKYYVYGYGCLYEVTDSLSQAMSAAAESGGVVVNHDAQTIWSRYKSKEKTIKVPEGALVTSDDTRMAAVGTLVRLAGASAGDISGSTTTECIESAVGNVINLTGSNIENALYYVDKGYPLIARTGSDEYCIVYGYTASSVKIYNMRTGEQSAYSFKEFDALTVPYGSVLITAAF